MNAIAANTEHTHQRRPYLYGGGPGFGGRDGSGVKPGHGMVNLSGLTCVRGKEGCGGSVYAQHGISRFANPPEQRFGGLDDLVHVGVDRALHRCNVVWCISVMPNTRKQR